MPAAWLIAIGSLVNVAEQRLKDTQSQGDDSPATPLRLTAAKLPTAHRSSALMVNINRQILSCKAVFACLCCGI